MAAIDPIEDLRQKLAVSEPTSPPALEPALGYTPPPPDRVLRDIEPARSVADLSAKLEPAASLPSDSLKRGALGMAENVAGALETLSSLGERSEPYASEAKQLGDEFARRAGEIKIPISSIRDIDFTGWDTAARDTFKLGVNAVFEMLPQIVPSLLAGAVIPGGALARTIATAVPSVVQEVGGIFRGVREETGKEAAGTAVLLGSLSGALETIVPAGILKRLLDTAPDEVKRATWRTLVGESAKAIGRSAGEEFATEAAQEALAVAANKIADSQYDAVNGENFVRLLDAGIKGALGGGTIGAAAEAVRVTPRLLRRNQGGESANAGIQEEKGRPEELLVPPQQLSVPTQRVATLGDAQPIPASGVTPESGPSLAPATFIGYQFSVPGRPPIPLFNLTEDAAGKLKGSTVAGKTLQDAGFQLPAIPEPPQQFSVPGQPITSWPVPSPLITPPTATGQAEILTLLDQAPIDPKSREVLREVIGQIKNPQYLDGLQFQLLPELPAEALGAPARYVPAERLIQIVQQSTDAALGPHELAHHLEQFLPAEERRLLAALQRETIRQTLAKRDLPLEARQLLENVLAKPLTSEEFVRLSGESSVDLSPWYHLSNPGEFLADAFSRKSLKSFTRRGELNSLLGRAKAFLRAVWEGIRRAFGNADARTEKIVNDLLKGKFKVTPQGGVSAEQRFALPKVVTQSESALIQASPDLRPEEQEAIKRLIGVQNAALVSPAARTEFFNLPQPVQDVLKPVANRIARINESGVSTDYRQAMADPNLDADTKGNLTLAGLYNFLDFERAKNSLTRARDRAIERYRTLMTPDVQEAVDEAKLQQDNLQQSIGELVAGYRDRVIADRNAAATAQKIDLAEAYNQELKDLELLRRNDTAFKTALQDIAENTSVDELNTLSPKELVDAWWTRNEIQPKVSQAVALQIFRVLKIEGRLNQQILDIKLLADRSFRNTVTQLDEMADRALSAKKLSLPEFLGKYYAQRSDLDAARRVLNRVRSKKTATMRRISTLQYGLGFIDAMQASPHYQQNRELILENSGAQSAEVAEVGDTTITYSNPYVPTEKITVYTGFNRQFAEAELATFQKLQEIGRRYVADPAADPLKRRAWEQILYQVDNFYLNPSFNPTSGKLIPLKLDLFRAATLGGFASVADYELSLIGGRAAAETLAATSAYSTAKLQLQSVFTRYQSKLNLITYRAAKAHKLTPTEWNEKVLEPLIASRQMTGAPALQQGDFTIYGYEILPSDIQALDAQLEYAQKVREIVLNDKEIASILLNPAKVLEKVAGRTIRRDPLARGSGMMPRRLSQDARDFSKLWLQTAGDLASQRQFLQENLVGDQLVKIVGSHAESLQDPSYVVKSDLRNDFRPLLQEWRAGHGPSNIAETIQALVAAQAGKPATEQLSSAQIMAALISDLNAIATNIARTEELRPEGAAKPILEVIDTNNSFTQARGNLIAPHSFYDHSVTDDRRKIYAIHDGLEFFAGNVIAKLEGLATAVGQTVRQYEQEIRGGKSQGQVSRESVQAQREGETFLNYQEAKTAEKRLRVFLQQFKDQHARRSGAEFEAINATSSIQNVVVGSLLQSVGTLLRNTFGGLTRFVQLDQSVGKGVTLLGKTVVPGWVPGAALTGGLLRGAATVGKEYVKLVEIGLASRALQSKTAKQLLGSVKKNPAFFEAWGGRIVQHMSEAYERHQRMLELGIGQPSAALDNLKAVWYLQEYGGKVVDETPGLTLKQRKDALRQLQFGEAVSGLGRGVLRRGEAVLGALAEVGAGLPRALFPRLLDLGINAGAIDWAGKQVEQLKINALQYLGNRAQLGADTRLTPQELLGNRFATEKQAATLRQLFLKQGMNLDKLMVDYYGAVQQAKAENRNPAEVPFLTDGERSSLDISVSEEVNLGTNTNRPPLLKARQLNRLLGMLMGYPLWLNTRFSLALARSTKTRIPAESLYLFSAWMMAMAFAAISSHELLRLLLPLIYNEERPIPSLANADNPTEALEILATNMAAFVPTLGGLYNYFGSTPNRTGFGIQFLPVEFIMDGMATARSMYQTQEVLNPAINFARRWVPNSRIVLNRLDTRDGLTEYYNVNRILRAEAPQGVELRKPSGGEIQQSPTTFMVQGMVNAAMREDPQEFFRLYQSAVESRRAAGVANPEESVQKSFAAKNFYTAVYGRELSDGERMQFFNKLTGEQAARIRDAESKFARFTELIGGNAPDFVKSESGGRGGSMISAPAMPFSAFSSVGAGAISSPSARIARPRGSRLLRGRRLPRPRRARVSTGRRRLLRPLRFK